MSEPLVTTRVNFIRVLQSIGFQPHPDRDHEVWYDEEKDFYLRFQHRGCPLDFQGPLVGNEYWVDPNVPTVEVGEFLRRWGRSVWPSTGRARGIQRGQT